MIVIVVIIIIAVVVLLADNTHLHHEPGRCSHHYPDHVERVLDKVYDVPQIRYVFQ